MEKNHISYIYEYSGKNKTRAAELLCIGLNTLRRKLKDYGID
jgi:DNA-binding protein Fis